VIGAIDDVGWRRRSQRGMGSSTKDRKICSSDSGQVVHLASGHRSHVDPKPEKHVVEHDNVASDIGWQKTKLSQNFSLNVPIGESCIFCTKNLCKAGVAGPDAINGPAILIGAVSDFLHTQNACDLGRSERSTRSLASVALENERKEGSGHADQDADTHTDHT
jgi:hypothetical protein